MTSKDNRYEKANIGTVYSMFNAILFLFFIVHYGILDQDVFLLTIHANVHYLSFFRSHYYLQLGLSDQLISLDKRK